MFHLKTTHVQHLNHIMAATIMVVTVIKVHGIGGTAVTEIIIEVIATETEEGTAEIDAGK